MRRRFGPDVEIFESAPIPDGWGTAQRWELRLLRKIIDTRLRDRIESFDRRHDYGDWPFEKEIAYMQYWSDERVFDGLHKNCGEVVKATRAEATTAFRELLAAASCGSVTSKREEKP